MPPPVAERNVELMRLRTHLTGLPSLEELTAKRPDIPGLVTFLEERSLHSIARLYQEVWN